MKKNLLILFSLLVVFAFNAKAQDVYITKAGKTTFFSKTSVEDIQAENNQTTLYVKADGSVGAAMYIKSFKFKKKLMEEHFNDQYMESDKFSRAKFKGKIEGFNPKMLSGSKSEVKLKGYMTIHGVTKEIVIPGILEMKNGQLHVHSTFMVVVADYNIEIPKTMGKQIAKEIKVTIDANCSKKK